MMDLRNMTSIDYIPGQREFLYWFFAWCVLTFAVSFAVAWVIDYRGKQKDKRDKQKFDEIAKENLRKRGILK